LAYDVLRRGGLAPAVLNAADEIAVDAFLQGKIRFTAIYRVVERTLAAHLRYSSGGHAGLAQIKQADAWARERAKEIIERL
jgi:1-deoxy-D-xylulose-5-phosphate reductoisomerase